MTSLLGKEGGGGGKGREGEGGKKKGEKGGGEGGVPSVGWVRVGWVYSRAVKFVPRNGVGQEISLGDGAEG